MIPLYSCDHLDELDGNTGSSPYPTFCEHECVGSLFYTVVYLST